MTSKGVKWIEMREELDGLFASILSIVSYMEREIAFAEKARREGPELMKKIPGMIEAAEKKLAEKKQSPRAAKYLEEARTQYAQAQAQQSGMTIMDWVILYTILDSVQSNVTSAESAHVSVNSSWSSSSSSDYGFSDSNSGFGGGGGFDSGGGGSSGDW